jgi:hypothetical protein
VHTVTFLSRATRRVAFGLAAILAIALTATLVTACTRRGVPPAGSTPSASGSTSTLGSPATPSTAGTSQTGGAGPSTSATPGAIAKAAAVLDAYCTAAGGDRVRTIRSLEIIGVSRSSAISGARSVQVQALFPNQYQQDEKPSSLKKNGVRTIITLNGEAGWFGGDAHLGGPGMSPNPAVAGKATTVAARQAFVNIMAGVLPVWLKDSERFTFVAAGTVDSGADKGTIELVLEGPDGHAGRLRLDATTHLPRRFLTERRADLGAAASAVTVTYLNYRPEHGILLPHTIESATDSGAKTTWTVASYVLNGKINPAIFFPSRGGPRRGAPLRGVPTRGRGGRGQ